MAGESKSEKWSSNGKKRMESECAMQAFNPAPLLLTICSGQFVAIERPVKFGGYGVLRDGERQYGHIEDTGNLLSVVPTAKPKGMGSDLTLVMFLRLPTTPGDDCCPSPECLMYSLG